MKNHIVLWISSIALFILSVSCKQNSNQQNQTYTIPPVSDSIPLIILKSYLNRQESINYKDIPLMLKSGKLFYTSDIKDELQSIFHIELQASTSLSNLSTKEQHCIITTIDSVDSRFLSVSVDSINFFEQYNQYPLWIKKNGQTSNPYKQITSYIHTGVTAITRGTGAYLDKHSIDNYLMYIKPYFLKPELVHISNEVSIDDSCSYSGMKLSFATKSKHLEILKKLRSSIVELTGNHNIDAGIPAYYKTLQWYKDNNIRYFGGGSTVQEAAKPLIVKLKDSSQIAWIGFNERCPLGECAGNRPGANRYSDEKARTLIDSLKNKAHIDYIIACVQFSEVDSYAPHGSQKTICKKLIDYGADVVIGSQAHIVQEIGIYKGKNIFYGTGNFLFDQTYKKGVRQAYFLQCYFYKGKIIQFHPRYTFMNAKKQPAIANDIEKSAIQDSILLEKNF